MYGNQISSRREFHHVEMLDYSRLQNLLQFDTVKEFATHSCVTMAYG
jgi:hypothetical protein